MPYVLLDGQQYTLAAGDTEAGSAERAGVRLASGAPELAAVFSVGSDGSTVIRRAGEPLVRVNGVPLGAEPSPLLHGDKIEIAGQELFFSDDRKAGNTQHVPSVRISQVISAARRRVDADGAPPAKGGRLISLVDGREYPVPDSGLVLGRDPTCDVVIPAGEASRKHALIARQGTRYVLTDTSANGVLINGARITSPTPLQRGDVVKVANEEFRFHADAASEAPAAPAPAPAPAPVSASAAPALSVLATLEVVSTGLLKGRTFEIRSALTHVGRGAHNDVVLPDESVSDSHAKIQHRQTGWYVADMDSTNGTYVGGRRIVGGGEALLTGAPNLRFGGVKCIFRVNGPEATEGTGMATGVGGGGTRVFAAPVAAAATTAAPERSRRRPVLLWIVLLALIIVAAFFLLTGR